MQAMQVFSDNLLKIQDWCPEALFYIGKDRVIEISDKYLKEHKKSLSSIFITVDNGKRFATNQCWIVKEDSGKFTTMTDRLFKSRYEPVPGSFPGVRKKH